MTDDPAARRWRGMALGALAGAGASAPLVFPTLFPLAWVALAPWLATVVRSTPRRAAAAGLVAGAVGYTIALYWLLGTLATFGEVPLAAAGVAFVAVVIFHAAQIALFAVALARLGHGPLALAAPVLWTAVEHVYPMLYPWRYAYTQSAALPLIQIADLAGPAGLTFLLLWANSAVSRLGNRQAPFRARIVPLLLVAATTAGALVYGRTRVAAIDRALASARSLRVVLVQGNLSIEEKRRPELWQANRELYRSLSRAAPASDVLIWPETTVHVRLRPGQRALSPGDHPLPGTTRPLIFGAVVHSVERGHTRRFNSALVVGTEKPPFERYDKTVLVPFGEYTPLRDVFPALARMNRGGSEYAAGDRLLALPVHGVRFAPLICYEDILPRLVRRAVRESRPDILLNLTNDGWFGKTVAPWQHHRLALWRAVEHRRPLVRATNTGLTAIVDPAGRTVAAAPPFVPTVLTAEVRTPRLPPTIYTRTGDLFAWLTTAAALVLLVLRRRQPPVAGGREGT